MLDAVTATLSPSAITREALRRLHMKLPFVGSITRDYDDSFARQGAKVGDVATLRLPNQYIVRSGFGAPEAVGDGEANITIRHQHGADLKFTRADLGLSLDDFSDRFIEPAIGPLAFEIERLARGMYADVFNEVSNHGQPCSFTKVLQARKILVDNLAPLNGRSCGLNDADAVDMVDALKGLFNDGSIATQRREGFMGRTAGFDFWSDGAWPAHHGGEAVGYVVVGKGQTGGTLRVGGGSHVANPGDVFTMPGVNRVHQETKQDTGQPQQFVVINHDIESLRFSPAICTTGPGQNVQLSPADGAAVIFSHRPDTSTGVSMAYQKGAFGFVSADMVMPRGIDFAAREVFDGLSMRLVRQYDINADAYPCRLDLLFGNRTVRPQLACRLANGGHR